jgi:hypothetical protein
MHPAAGIRGYRVTDGCSSEPPDVVGQRDPVNLSSQHERRHEFLPGRSLTGGLRHTNELVEPLAEGRRKRHPEGDLGTDRKPLITRDGFSTSSIATLRHRRMIYM